MAITEQTRRGNKRQNQNPETGSRTAGDIHQNHNHGDVDHGAGVRQIQGLPLPTRAEYGEHNQEEIQRYPDIQLNRWQRNANQIAARVAAESVQNQKRQDDGYSGDVDDAGNPLPQITQLLKIGSVHK